MKYNDTHNRLAMMVVSAALLCVVAAAVIVPGRLGNLEALKDWGDILGGVLTLMAAGVAANYVVAQMRHAQAIEDDRLARARRAWLATMPETMSAVCSYALASYDGLVAQHAVATRATGLQAANNPVGTPPSLTDQTLADVRSMIEVASDREADGYICLLSEIQVHRVRWGDRLERLRKGQNLLAIELGSEMVEAAELYARASNLLGSARPNPTPMDQIATTRLRALRLMSDNLQPIASVAELANARDISSPLSVP